MPKHSIIGIGEILWDVFPDGPRFGGAPANFASSAAELAQDSAHVVMVSAVGDDKLGRAALGSLNERGVDTFGVQLDERDTGRVLVALDDAGVASYRFDDDSAWDHLTWTDTLSSIAMSCDAVCFGTLGQRGQRSKDTIQEFVKTTRDSCLRILDVNLRKPFFSDELIRESLSFVDVLKLNDEELSLLARLSGLAGNDIELMRQLAGRYQLRYVALTRGADGAVIVSEDEISDLPGIPVDVVDTVGAGDAFTAAMTLGLLAEESIHTINRKAIAAASYVCSKPGATMTFPEHLLHR